ncbi:MAG: Nif3-like dinuclear metal center hexameric protein [Oscillospiraceae bacterium]|nr:Nif3-like dinuclear metal center hexameric protein [Oscillospiraceae bacterium]
MTVKQIFELIDKTAPFSTQMDFDNAGLLVGDPNQQVAKALLALDCTPQVVEEAEKLGAQLIITHHPLIWQPMKKVTAESLVYRLIRSNISLISAHTNLDVSPIGVNEYLARTLGLEDIEPLEITSTDEDNVYALGRVGTLPTALTAEEFAHRTAELLDCNGIRYTGWGGQITKVAVCGGSGGSMVGKALAAGAQALVTGDVKHDVFLAAAAAGLVLVDAGHFETETVILPHLCELLEEQAPSVTFTIAQSNIAPIRTV